MDLSWLEDPILGPDILIKHMIIAGAILFAGLILSIIIPRIVSKKIKDIFVKAQVRTKTKAKGKEKIEIEEIRKRAEYRLKQTLERPLRRSLSISLFLLSILIALMSIDIGLDTEIKILGSSFEAWQFLQLTVILGLILIFVIIAVDPIVRAIVYSLLGDRLNKSRKYKLFRAFRTPSKLLVVIIGVYIAINTTFSDSQISKQEWISDALLFGLVILAAYFLGQIIVLYTEPSFRGNERSTRNASKIVGRLIKAGIYILGGLVGFTLMGLDLYLIATSLGLIGFALAFGLQDTVANFAAGVMIAIDKPFVVGDRIRLDWGGNETWGDVRDMSLRSTWIKTPEGEMIVIPNNVIASSQVWNYTRDSPKLALHFDVGISYDSDWKLAENLILEILKNHPLVLDTPSPYVLLKEFGESSQILTLWFWIPEARDKVVIQSDILKRVKDAFDRNGVEIPYPYRTLVYKNDIQKPKVLGEDYKSPIFLPSEDFRQFKVKGDDVMDMGIENSVVLAPTSSPYPARITAPYVMETAKRLGASVTALFINTPGSYLSEGKKALQIYNEIAKKAGVPIKLLYKQGDVLENILMVVEQEKASIVVMGSTEESLFHSLTRRSISRELLIHLNIPTMVVPVKMRREMKKEVDDYQYDDGFADLGTIRELEDLESKGPQRNIRRRH